MGGESHLLIFLSFFFILTRLECFVVVWSINALIPRTPKHRGFTYIAWLGFPQAYTRRYTAFLVKQKKKKHTALPVLLFILLHPVLNESLQFSVWLLWLLRWWRHFIHWAIYSLFFFLSLSEVAINGSKHVTTCFTDLICTSMEVLVWSGTLKPEVQHLPPPTCNYSQGTKVDAFFQPAGRDYYQFYMTINASLSCNKSVWTSSGNFSSVAHFQD